MKKMALFLALVFIFSASVSCNDAKGDPFAVFDCNFTVSVDAVCEGTPCSFEYNSKEKSARFTAPAELAGYALRLDGEKALLSYEDIEMEISSYAGRLIFICDEVFYSNANEITDITAQKTSLGTLTLVKTKSCEYLFTSDGSPISISGYSDGVVFELTLGDFRGSDI